MALFKQKWSIETNILEDGKHIVPSIIESIRHRIDLYNMKKEDELLKELTDMVKETKKGQIKWKLSCQTTEYNDERKPTVTEDGITWTVDECYVSYECTYKAVIL